MGKFIKSAGIGLAAGMMTFGIAGCRSKTAATEIKTDATSISREEILITRLSEQIEARLLTLSIDSPNIEIRYTPEQAVEQIKIIGKGLHVSKAARDSVKICEAANIEINDSTKVRGELQQMRQTASKGLPGISFWLTAGVITGVMLCCLTLYRRNRPL